MKNNNKWKVCVQHKQHSRKLYNRQTFLVYVLCLEFTAWRAGVNSPAAASRFQGEGVEGERPIRSKANHFLLLINSGSITWNKGTLIMLHMKCLLIFFPNGSVCIRTFETIWFEYQVAHLVVVVRVFFDGLSFVFGNI